MIVYHYCSLESLNSILKNRSLRLTNILKSNDSMEISWICRYYDAEFKRAYENASDLFRSKISSERLMGYVKLFTDEFFNENHADFRYYVTCFSYQNDLLSQWTGRQGSFPPDHLVYRYHCSHLQQLPGGLLCRVLPSGNRQGVLPWKNSP